MQRFLKEVSSLGEGLIAVASQQWSADYFVAGVVTGAVTVEAVRRHFRKRTPSRNGVSPEDSDWVQRSGLPELPVSDDA